MHNVIEPLSREELDKIFDSYSIEVIEFFLKELFLTKPEVLKGQKDVPIYAPQEYVEQWFVQALGAKPMGAGSYPIDILKENEYGADIKSLTYKSDEKGNLKNTQSGEASLGQKFDTDNDTNVLDQLFADNKRDEILNLWIKILKDKYNKVRQGKNLNLPLYFFFILRGNVDFYLVGASIHPENIKYLSVNEKKSTQKSVFVDNYIDKKYGNCKIYKSKKRMELRLKPKYWIENNKSIKFEIPQQRVEKDLRKLSLEKKLDDYLKEKFYIVDKLDDIVD